MPSTDRLAASARPRSTLMLDSQRSPSAMSVRNGSRRRCRRGGRGRRAEWMNTSSAATAKVTASNAERKPHRDDEQHAADRACRRSCWRRSRRRIVGRSPSRATRSARSTGPLPARRCRRTPRRQPRHAGGDPQHPHLARCPRRRRSSGRRSTRRGRRRRAPSAGDDRCDRRMAPTGSDNSSHGNAAATPMNEIDNSLRVSRDASNGKRDDEHTVAEVGDRACRPQTPEGRREPGRGRQWNSPWGRSDQIWRDLRMIVPHVEATLVGQVGNSCRRTLPDDVVGRLSTRRISLGAMYIGSESASHGANRREGRWDRPDRVARSRRRSAGPTRRRARRQRRPRRRPGVPPERCFDGCRPHVLATGDDQVAAPAVHVQPAVVADRRRGRRSGTSRRRRGSVRRGSSAAASGSGGGSRRARRSRTSTPSSGRPS